MAFVVTDLCTKCTPRACAEVCPVSCFHEAERMLVIDPDACIDCTLCEPECPQNAIRSEDELDVPQQHFVRLNAELSKESPAVTLAED